MMINDPLGDLIARIKNAATRERSKVLTPASTTARARPRRAAGRRLHPRLPPGAERPGDFPEFEIELKYFDGAPVIVEIARVSKPGRRVYSSITDLKPIKNGLGISILSTSEGRHVGHRRARRQRGRRSPLQGLLRCPVSERRPSPSPKGVTVTSTARRSR